MKMKRIFAFIGALAITFACGVYSKNYQAKANGNNIGNFSEDFESYEVGNYIENTNGFKERWTNNVLKGGEAQGMDGHLINVGKIEYEDASSNNKVLHLNNTVGNDSFFQIGPNGDYRTKNFTVSFRLKYLVSGVPERTWVGVSFRKKAECHYTGTNNLMFVVQRYKNSAQVSSQPYAVFNGGDVNDLLSENIQNMFPGAITGEKNDYTIPNAQADVDTPWINYKLEVNEKTYKIYLDDTLVMNCTFNSTAYDYFGYLSLNCCQANVLVDDFMVVNNDSTLPPEIAPLPAPVLRFNEEKNRIEWDEVEGVYLYSVYVNGQHRTTKARRYYEMDKNLEPGEYKVQVVSVSDDTFIALDSLKSEAYVYTVKGEESSSEVESSSSEKVETGKKKGCKSSFNGFALLAGLGIVVILKKRNEK